MRILALVMAVTLVAAHSTAFAEPTVSPRAAMPAVMAEASEDGPRVVKVIAPDRMSPDGTSQVPVFTSLDWSAPQPDVERAVVILHGRLRNADTYFQTAQSALSASGLPTKTTLLIAPQFLSPADVARHGLPADTLRWSSSGWEGGSDAPAPAPISPFAVLDAIIERLADRSRFPNLRHIVIAGHSGGAQLAQRFAIATRSADRIANQGIGLRWVVANPSSYAYFSSTRPAPPLAGACPRFDDWKYGMRRLPPYIARANPAMLEQGYLARQVWYLLGERDTNPQQSALDRSCMAQAQGLNRMARGLAYYAYLKSRAPTNTTHSLWTVPNVAHNGQAMFTSRCGVAALFDVGNCGPAR